MNEDYREADNKYLRLLMNKILRSFSRAFFVHPIVKVIAIILIATVIIAAALAPISSLIVESWLRKDIDIRSKLIFRSVRDKLITNQKTNESDITSYLERIAEDERLLALGYCTEGGKLLYATAQMPNNLSCEILSDEKDDTFDISTNAGTHAQVSSIIMEDGIKGGHLLVVHDLTYIDHRSSKAQLYTIVALTGVSVGLGILVIGVGLMMIRGWTRSIRGAISDINEFPSRVPTKTGLPIDREVQKLISAMRLDRKFAEGIYVQWSPATLCQLLQNELPNTQVMIISNREPYIHNCVNGQMTLQLPASGLVSALEPVMRTCRGIWIAHGSGSADRETVDSKDRIRVPPSDPTYTLRRVWLNELEQEGFYYGLSNEGLWPLCHIAFVRPNFRASDWEQYVAVNNRFADVACEEATCDDPIILIQDYHFALLPRLIRDRIPKATIITFWHIPWPNSETFGICPWRSEIIDGLLASSILGFHTQLHCNNFIEAVDRFMESRIDRENGSIAFRGHEVIVRPYPISIEWPPNVMSTQCSIKEGRQKLLLRLGLPDDVRIGVGIERFDYTKGILDRMNAVDTFLTLHPEWRGKFVFLQAAAPTRSKLASYSSLEVEANLLANEINKRHATFDWKPIHLFIRHHEQKEVYELFRCADMCIVSSLHDGMNLVAKEFVAARDDERGVLILSSFAGAAQELSEALIVNPYDVNSMATAINYALSMSENEQCERMRLMRDQVKQHNVYGWAAQMLLHAAHIRKKERLLHAAKQIIRKK